MNYLVFDLEFNQAWDLEEGSSRIVSSCPFEIIQIGALKLDEQLQEISGFNRLVRPELYTDLHPFVEKFTGITSERLESAASFSEVYGELLQFLDSESILCVWGISDIKELLRNISYHNLDSSPVPKKYINIQRYASGRLSCPKGTNIGLRNAVEILGISIQGSFHDAFNDALYTAEVFRCIYGNGIKPALYQPKEGIKARSGRVKTQLDTAALIGQFEKMYSRQMTEEEQAIIRLAYLMGNTGQFQKESPHHISGSVLLE
ncbi:MAG TPA: 3'-5' exonuclease [Negativicutes bacterium]|nr:3'-5' exonuclease [Negativicutes bacterium]